MPSVGNKFNSAFPTSSEPAMLTKYSLKNFSYSRIIGYNLVIFHQGDTRERLDFPRKNRFDSFPKLSIVTKILKIKVLIIVTLGIT